MISCQDADVLAAALSVGSIDAGDQVVLQQHVAECAECRRLAGEYMEAAALLPLALAPLQPSPELRGRLMRAVYAEAGRARAVAPAAVPRSWWGRMWRALPTGRGFTLGAAIAAAAVIALVSWTVLHRQAPSPAPVSVTLMATPAAPNAHGQLVYTPGSHDAVLTVTGLPGPASIAGRTGVYEVWLLRPNGAAVPATYLSQDPDGTWSAALHSDLAGYSTVAATVEPQGGSLTPTGVKVIEGFLTGTSMSAPAGGMS